MSTQNQFLQWEDTLDPSLSPGEPRETNVSNFERGLSIAIGAWMLYRGLKKLGKSPISKPHQGWNRRGLFVQGCYRILPGLWPIQY